MAASEAVKRGMAKLRKKRFAWIQSLKAGPCMDCRQTYPPECMDFDHKDKESKRFGIAQGVSRCQESVLTEIAKCDLICANCHRIRTHKKKLDITP